MVNYRNKLLKHVKILEELEEEEGEEWDEEDRRELFGEGRSKQSKRSKARVSNTLIAPLNSLTGLNYLLGESPLEITVLQMSLLKLHTF